ncbi:Polysaccharide deacetylase [Novipirellula aureliae]|uniref:Polysaccharide deacetylase n=1 Tax=Novipirellula aureliae TaxID=2527966 RepID=A0A5C6DQM9_9BACT|nr:polysaccharide deacetylase family protein [Novipirellula aureliae]TWU39058.1 Polysaccharide deacetylase [Novipirellula aureliae]
MNTIQAAALRARVVVTSPVRKVRNRRLILRGTAPMFVPFYHRVADTHPNDWTISRDDFLSHVDYCQARFDLVGLNEIQRRVGRNHSPRPSVTFTFDDGYAENLDFALPLLADRQIPCVYFVTVDAIENQTPFPHDIEAGVRLAVNTAAQLREISAMGIEIGLHTRSHIDFSNVTDPAVLHDEIVHAKERLEDIIGDQVRYFAFPYGLPPQLTPQAIEMVHESGMHGFCSAFGAYNLVGRDAFHIRRFHGDPNFSRFQNWLSFDPAKVSNEPKIEYK